MDCSCRSLGVGFACDPERPFLGGDFVEVDASDAAWLRRCTRCGQHWQVDRVGRPPFAWRVDGTAGWRDLDVGRLREAHAARFPEGRARLPVWAFVREAARVSWGGRRVLLRLAAWPWLGLVATDLVMRLARYDDESDVRHRVLRETVELAILAWLWVRGSRFFLLGQAGGTGCGWGRREAQTWMWTAVLSLPVTALLDTEYGPLSSLSIPILSIVWLYVWARVSLVLPAIAADAASGPAQAWSLSRGHGLRLAGLAVAGPLATLLASSPLLLPFVWLPEEADRSWLVSSLEVMTGAVVHLLVETVGIATTALAYRWLARASGISAGSTSP